jgi:hypothetical protein
MRSAPGARSGERAARPDKISRRSVAGHRTSWRIIASRPCVEKKSTAEPSGVHAPGLVSVCIDRADSHRAVHVSGREGDPRSPRSPGSPARSSRQRGWKSDIPAWAARTEIILAHIDAWRAGEEELLMALLATALALLAPFQKHRVSSDARRNGPSARCRSFAGIISPLSAEIRASPDS